MSSFLDSCTLLAEEQIVWPSGIPLTLAGYRVERADQMPLDSVTSVRCIVLRGGDVLVLRKPNEDYILPGGRRESDESLEATLHREVLEETGWTIGQPQLIGCLHFRHLAPEPDGYRYPYPDFLQPVYVAEALEYNVDALGHDPLDGDAIFVPAVESGALPLRACQRALLELALAAHRDNPPDPTPRPM